MDYYNNTEVFETGKMHDTQSLALISWRRAFAAAVLALLPVCPTSAQGQVDDLRHIYESGDYLVAAKLSQELLATRPQDALIHYYLASSLAKLGRTAEARAEYNKCLTLGRGTAVAQNAAMALQMTAGGAAASARGSSAGAEAPLSEQSKRARAHLLMQEDSEKQVARRHFDEKVREYQRETQGRNDPGFDAAVKQKTQQAFEQLSAEEAAITERYQKRADALFKPQPESATGSGTHVVQQGSNMYVQNFENLGDESQAATIPSENPLTAKAYRLGEGGRKKKNTTKKAPATGK
jgi:tetratricopeptide (TPR) repeat protein